MVQVEDGSALVPLRSTPLRSAPLRSVCRPSDQAELPLLGEARFTAACGLCRSDEDSEDESLSHGGRQNHDNLYRVHMPSLYSCGSSYGSETSIPAAAHTVSNAPVTEYM